MAYHYKKKRFHVVQSLAGAGLLLLGILLTLFSESKSAGFAMMSGATLCLSGLLGLGLARLAYTPAEKEQASRRESIESGDERNTAIREKSAWATQRAMLVVLGAFVTLATFLLPYNLTLIVAGWGLLIVNAVLPCAFAAFYSKRL